MEIFNLTLKQMLMMFTLIVVGYILRKKKILPDNASTVMSRLETFIFVPALSLFNQMSKCTIETFTENSVLILYGLIITICVIILAVPLSMLFVPKAGDAKLKYQRNIYRYSMTFSNYGFMGNFIILGVWGNDMFFKYALLTFCLGIACSSYGLYILIPKDEGQSLLHNLKKGLLTPPIIALVAGMLFGILNLSKYVPDFMMTAFEKASACQGPVAMVLAGFVIGGYNFKELITNGKVYIASLLRLIVIPAVLMIVLKLLGTSDEIMTLVLVAFACPLGLNTIVYPAAYGGDTKTGASMAMISHTLSVITIPLMYLVFIVLL